MLQSPAPLFWLSKNSWSLVGIVVAVAISSLGILPIGSQVVGEEKQPIKKTARPIRALLVTGGCCHDYPRQKQLLTKGISARADVEWTVVHQGGATTTAEIPLYRDPNWADGFDVVVHNECFADAKDPAWVDRVLAPHRNGTPAVLIHCAMHCYRTGTDKWFEFCGVQSPGHGPHYAYTVENKKSDHPIMKGFGDTWRVPKGELYHTIKLWPSATVLGEAKRQDNNENQVCVWTNLYGNTRVFGTTIGHYNETMAESTYLDMVTRGLLWAVHGDSIPELKPVSKEVADEIVAIARGERDNAKPSAGKCCGEGNLLLGKKTTASSEEVSKNNFSGKAVDGDVRSRWCANGGGKGEWLQIELPETVSIKSLRLHWEQESAYQYRVETSLDGEKFQTVVDEKENKKVQRIVGHSISPTEVKFLRVVFLGASTGVWGSLWEVEAYEGDLPKLPDGLSQNDSGSPNLADVVVAEGFDVQVFAEPPQVNYPVCLTTGANGEVFVGIDEQGSLGKEAGRGRIVRCVDRDGDGKADEIKTFAKVDHPRGMVYDAGNLWVLHPPFLTLYQDTDLDGVADQSKELIRGISTDQVQQRGADHTTNGIRMGIDGWIYIAVGDFGFSKAIAADGTELSRRGGGIVRVRPDGSDMEVYAWGLRNILDVCIDPKLDMFTRDNTNDGGGWNVRVSHILQGAEYGYPSRYINYADETMPPLADYGGGSGCGGMYLYERRWPEAFRNAAYTCDWGTSEVYIHRLVADGPTFKPHQETFLKIARPTDIDIDTSGRMLVSSWLNGGFSYSGDNVGFIAQVIPKDFLPKPFPYLTDLPAEKIVDLLKTSGAAGQFHASRELLRRGEQEQIGSMLLELSADSNASVETRVAAIFTLKQLVGRKANNLLQNLGKKDPSIRRWALRALTDRIDEIEPDNIAWIGECLKDSDVAVQAQALVSLRQAAGSQSLSRETKASIANLVLEMPGLSRAWQPQPHQLPQVERVLPHLAMLTLAKLDAAEPVVEALSGSQRQLALLTLRQMHSEAAVGAIIRRLYRPVDDDLRTELLSLLSRLYFEEGAYQRGDWWGTRPDTTGPYYDRQTWAMTDRIDRVLKATFEQGDTNLRQKMQKDFDRFKLPLSKDAAGSSIAAEEMKQQPIVIEHVDPTNPQLLGNQRLEVIQQKVVSLKGNPEAGKKLFENQACIACHTFADGQTPKGPHLVDIGRRYTRPELVESLIQPSAKIAQGFDSWQFLTRDGEVLTGFVVTESAERVLLRNGQGVLQALSQDDIEERKKQEQSMMPQGLVGALTVEQLSDLLAYLETLK
jgi:putative membrane-bound dehydrogenase-like protein